MEKPGRYHLNQVIKVNIISNGTNRNYSPPDRTLEEECSVTFVIFLLKMPYQSGFNERNRATRNWSKKFHLLQLSDLVNQ